MITCCELALVLCGVILAMLAMFFNYNLKLKDKSIELTKRTTELEKKNGFEQHQIDELKTKLQSLESLLELGKNNTPNTTIPPAPPFTPQPKSQSKPNPTTDFVQELKDKQNQGKVKPSQFKKS